MRNTSVIPRSLTATAFALVGLATGAVTAAPAATAANGVEPVPAALAAAPRAVSTTCVWTNAIHVNWSPVFSSTAPTVTSYEVAAFYTSGWNTSGTQAASKTVFPWTTGADVGGLRPGTRYQFKVRAKNSAGWSPWSTGTYATTAR